VAAEVVLRGPGHHERAERARPVIAAISTLGVEVVVSTDLRPRLADDVRGLLEAGATRVRLEADGIAGELASTGDDRAYRASGSEGLGPNTVLVVLKAGSATPPEVVGEGKLADSVRGVLSALTSSPSGVDH
jgi:hypothetical protein